MHMHIWLTYENEETFLLVRNWEWLPNAGWHPRAGFSWVFLLFLTLINYFSTRAILLQNKHFSSCFIFWFNHGKSGNFITFTFATIYFSTGQFLWLALKINQFSYFWWCNSANGTHLLFIHFLHLPFTYETIIKICSSLLNTVWFFCLGFKLFRKCKNLSVVYFDQRLGAAHSKRWSK